MKKCLPSIVSAAHCLSLDMTPNVPEAAAESSEIYGGDNYDENYDISLLSADAARIHIPRRGAILTDLQITAPSLTRSS